MSIKNILLPFLFSFFLITNLKAQSMEDGLAYMNNERYGKAKEVFQSLIKKSPNADYYYYLGEIYLSTEAPDSAKWAFKEGIKVSEKAPLCYAGLGKVFFASNKEEAKANFDNALALSKSKNPKVLLSIADFYISSDYKNYSYAMELLDRAIKYDERNPEIYLLYGDAYLEQNDGSKAMEKYNKAIFYDSNYAKSYLKIGKLYSRAKNHDLGLMNYEKAIAIDPDYAPAYKEIGEVYYKTKKIDKAITAYKTYVEKTDNNDFSKFRYASFLFLNGDYKASIDILEPLVAQKDVNPIAYRLLAYANYELKDFDKGLRYMNTFWKTGYANHITTDYEYYGRILSKTGNDSLAVVNLYKALEKNPGKIELYSEIADLQSARKNYAGAAEAYVLKLGKSTPTAQDYLNLGRAYLFSEQFELADSVFAKLTELRPDLTIGFMYRGKANANLDPESEKGLAKPHYEKVVEIVGSEKEKHKKDLIEAHSYLGYFYLLNKDNAKALVHWKEVYQLDPSNKNADQVIKGLQQN
ncbi:MAG: tetratricopeptide repeat protein [Cytophagaceae bacterium]